MYCERLEPDENGNAIRTFVGDRALHLYGDDLEGRASAIIHMVNAAYSAAAAGAYVEIDTAAARHDFMRFFVFRTMEDRNALRIAAILQLHEGMPEVDPASTVTVQIDKSQVRTTNTSDWRN